LFITLLVISNTFYDKYSAFLGITSQEV